MLESLTNYLQSPQWRRQHRWRRAIWLGMSRVGLTGLHSLPLNRRWVDIHRRPMAFNNLDASMVGLKIVQISDLHHSPVVSRRYLVQYIRWINELKPDLVVITGDLITGGYRYADRVAAILSHLEAPRGVICTFGNHDYGMYGAINDAEARRRGEYLQQRLTRAGLTVLRNERFFLQNESGRPVLALVGLDDEWTGRIDPDKAFSGITPGVPTVCLNHNPVNVRELLGYPWQWMLSGHTHGRSIATSKFGRTFYPHKFREFTHGYYAVQGRNLYVNRGLSYGQRVLDWCRPEITVFKLQNAEKP